MNRDNKICSWVPLESDLRKDSLAMPSKNLKTTDPTSRQSGHPISTNPLLPKNN
jgi:hypothetical protein